MRDGKKASVTILLAGAIVLSGLCFLAWLPSAATGDHGYKGKQVGRNLFHASGHGRGDRGNEFTGESTAWLFAAANVPVVLSLLLRGFVHTTSMSGSLKDRLKKFNQVQKKYLMPLHYILNPLAVLLAFVHFGLSHCRSSALPEWGLAVMTSLAIIGILVKFKISPKSLRRTVYQIHTNPLPVGLLVIILLVGHSIVG